MNFPPFNDPWDKSRKASDRPPVKAPADLNWDAIESKVRQRKQPVVTGEPKYDSSGYLGRMRDEDPWPAKDNKNTDGVSLVNCRFLTPTADLVPDEPCTVACDVKVLQPPSSREVNFRLQYRLADKDPWTDSNESATASLRSDLPNQTVQTDLTLYCPTPAPELGTTIHYRVVAEHPEAADSAEGPDTPVQLRNQCQYLGAPEISFRNDGECPLLDESGGLVQALAAVVKQLSLPQPMGSDTVIVFGFASSPGSDAHNRDLSLRRAQALKTLLDHDGGAWTDLAKAHFKTIDIQQILSGLTIAFGWPCDPGTVDGLEGPKTRGAVKAFQAECNSRYSLALKEDGACGPKTWGAVHRAIRTQVAKASGQDPSAEPSWAEIPWGYPEGEGVYACGEDFAPGGDAASDRHAEICVFGSNLEPELKVPATGAKVTIAEDPVEDPEKFVKVKLTGLVTDPAASAFDVPPQKPFLLPQDSSSSNIEDFDQPILVAANDDALVVSLISEAREQNAKRGKDTAPTSKGTGVFIPFHIVDKESRPNIHFDHGFLQGANGEIDESKRRSPTFADYQALLKWKTKLSGAELLRPDLIDATNAYRHFLEGNGREWRFDYNKYARDDRAGQFSVTSATEDAIAAAIDLSDMLHLPDFSMETDPISVGNSDDPTKVNPRYPYPGTENWQKAIGAHILWVFGRVHVETSDSTRHFKIQLFLHAEDRYNFNPGMKNIATGTPDAENGRFEVTGLGKEFSSLSNIQRVAEFSTSIVPVADSRVQPQKLKTSIPRRG